MVFNRQIAVWCLTLLFLSACNSIQSVGVGRTILIEFQETRAEGKQGIVAIASDRLDYADILRFEDVIRGEVYVGRPPSDLDACFYLSPDSYGLVRVRYRTADSFVLDIEKYPDAGVSYRFELKSDGTITGSRGFWSSAAPRVETGIEGNFTRVDDISACTTRFPANRPPST